MRIEGHELVYTVKPDPNIAWPVVVDPYVSEDQRYWSANASVDFLGWSKGYSGGSFGTLDGTSGYGRGLYLYSYPGSPYATGAYAAWRYQAPSNPAYLADGARIFKADFSYVTHTVSNLGSCVGEGIYKNSAGTFEPAGRFRGPQTTDTYANYASPYSFGYLNCAPLSNGYTVHCLAVCGVDGGPSTGGSPANSVALQLFQGAGTPSTGSTVFMAGALIFMSESVGARTVFESTAPASWTKDPFTIKAKVTDYGLGIQSASFVAPNAGSLGSATQSGTCADGAAPNGGGTPGSANQGDRDHRCTDPLTLTQSSAGLPEGSYNVSVVGNDILGNPMQTPNTTPVKIDRSAPNLSLTGTLWEHRDKLVYGQAYTVGAAASDSQSGVASVSIKLDGAEVHPPKTQTGCDGCPLSDSFTFDGSDVALETGTHTVSVVTTNAAGIETISNWEVELADQDPPMTEDEQIDASIKFRQDNGLRADDAYVRSLLLDRSLPGLSDFGVQLTSSEIAEMDRRTQLESDRRTVEARARANYPADFAGAWIDQAGGGYLRVAFTQNETQHTQDLASVVNDPDRLRGLTVSANEQTLASAAQTLSDALDTDPNLTQLGLNGIGIDVSTNSIVVDADDPNAAGLGDSVASLIPSGIPLRVEDSTAEAIPVSSTGLIRPSRRDRFADPLVGGLRISRSVVPGYCTNAWSGIQLDYPYQGVISNFTYTAGHCNIGNYDFYQGGLPLKPIDLDTFRNGSSSDAGIIFFSRNARRVPSNVLSGQTIDQVYVTPKHLRNITRHQSNDDDGVGDRVCYSGSSTGYNCGRIVRMMNSKTVELEATPRRVANIKRLRLARFSKTCKEGDSGSPVLWGSEAKGILSSYSDKDAHLCYFSHIENAIIGIRDVSQGGNP